MNPLNDTGVAISIKLPASMPTVPAQTESRASLTGGPLLPAGCLGLPADRQHFFDRPYPRDRFLREIECQRDRAHQPPIDIYRASAHPLHDASLLQRSARKRARMMDCLGPDVFQHAQNFHLKFLDFVAGKDSLANAVLPGANIAQRKNGGLRKKSRCYNQETKKRSTPTRLF